MGLKIGYNGNEVGEEHLEITRESVPVVEDLYHLGDARDLFGLSTNSYRSFSKAREDFVNCAIIYISSFGCLSSMQHCMKLEGFAPRGNNCIRFNV